MEYYKQLVEQGNYKEVALELMEKYYDPMYGVSSKKHTFREVIEVNDLNKGIKELERIYKEVLDETLEDGYEQRDKE